MVFSQLAHCTPQATRTGKPHTDDQAPGPRHICLRCRMSLTALGLRPSQAVTADGPPGTAVLAWTVCCQHHSPHLKGSQAALRSRLCPGRQWDCPDRGHSLHLAYMAHTSAMLLQALPQTDTGCTPPQLTGPAS